MKDFVTYRELEQIGREIDEQKLLKEANILQYKTVFLSHSSSDHKLIPGVIRIIEGHGAKVYIDERDPELPKDNFEKVAVRLREAVKACRKFILFVTPNSKDSKWIPWELGLGDGCNTNSGVALFPSAEESNKQSWTETEYLGLYDRIIWGNFQGEKPEWLVLNFKQNSAVRLIKWLSSN